jgi:predicted small metal-binding protein
MEETKNTETLLNLMEEMNKKNFVSFESFIYILILNSIEETKNTFFKENSLSTIQVTSTNVEGFLQDFMNFLTKETYSTGKSIADISELTDKTTQHVKKMHEEFSIFNESKIENIKSKTKKIH